MPKTQIILEINGREYIHSIGRLCSITFARNLCRESYTGAQTIIKSIKNVIPVDRYGDEIKNSIINWFNPNYKTN